MTTRIKLNQIIALYLTQSNKEAISYEDLQQYILYIQNSFKKDKKDVSILYSSEDLKELKYGRDDYFTANHFGIETKVSLQSLSRDVVSYIPLDEFLSAYQYTEEYIKDENSKQTEKKQTRKVKKNEKPL